MEKIAVIIPAYNEQEAIGAVVNGIRSMAEDHGLALNVVVVNDCSTDHTSAVISGLNCIALELPVNLGIGGAMQTGFKYAFENNYDLAVQVDGDGQHPPGGIPVLLKAMKEQSLDVAIGSRFIERSGFQSSFMRRFGIGWFRIVNKLLTGNDIKDSTSGFRMLNRKALAIVYDYYPDEYPEPEAIVLYSKHKLKIGEVAVEMKERQGGTTSIGFFSSIYYMWKVTLGIFFTFIRSNP